MHMFINNTFLQYFLRMQTQKTVIIVASTTCFLKPKVGEMTPCMVAPFMTTALHTPLLHLSNMSHQYLRMFPTCFSTPSSKLSYTASMPDSSYRRTHGNLVLQPFASASATMTKTQDPCATITKTQDPIAKELNVTIHKSSLVTPIEETERKSMFLSNIDHTLNFKVSQVFFFSKNPSFPPETVVEMIRTALRKLLVPYAYMAGRLKRDEQGLRLEIDCNSAGAGFVAASSELSLEELGDLVLPNQHHQKLATRKLIGIHADNQPLIIIQVTSFKCGGFALGMSINHMLLDGIGYKVFLENLASVAGDNGLVHFPQTDRGILAARDPPQVKFQHPELLTLESLLSDRSKLPPLSFSAKKLQCKRFYLSSNDINHLKDEAKNFDISSCNHKANICSNVVAAHIWRCIGLAKNTRNEPDKMFSMLYAVNFRRRFKPRIPISFTGNAIYNAYCSTTCYELENGDFGDLVQLIEQEIEKVGEEYVRSATDWGEVNKRRGVMYGDILVSSWWHLGLMDPVYPWGKAIWHSPVMQNHGNNAVLLLPDIEGTSTKNGVNVMVSLQPKDMDRFQVLFDKFLK